MPLPIHQDGVENRDKAYCRFASPICDYILFNRKKYKVNYYLGMKDMLGDMMQDHAISVIIVIWRALQNRSSVTEHGSFFIPLRLNFFLHRPCYHLVLFLSGIVLYPFWTRGLVFELLPEAYMFYYVRYKRLQGAALSR